jgi:hypothetical protein
VYFRSYIFLLNTSSDEIEDGQFSPLHARGLSPALATLFAASLLVLGFLVGYGFHTAKSEEKAASTRPTVMLRRQPVVKGLRVSPDGNFAAFAVVVGNRRAFRLIVDLKTKKVSARPSPSGWQDYLVQWSADGKHLLFDREKIPRAVEDATSGLHAEDIDRMSANTDRDFLRRAAPRALTAPGVLPSGEKSIAGFWTPGGDLIVKTRREPKALYNVKNGKAALIDHANVTYYQNRAVRENGKLVLYVVRDYPGGARTQSALFRVEGKKESRISEPFGEAEWIYVAEGARWMIVCREQDENNWRWELFAVTHRRATRVRDAAVTKDVIGVFWSPDSKNVLGASGKSLWLISVPELQTRKLGTRDDWNADDAAWIPAGQNKGDVLVAAGGALWHVNAKSGATKRILQLPEPFWNVLPQ